MKKWPSWISAAVVLLMCACAISGPPPTPTPAPTPTPELPAGSVEHKLDIIDWVHESIEIKVGESVHWTNQSKSLLHSTTHTPFEGDLQWASPLLHPGDSFRHTFTEPGTYRYVCRVHVNTLKMQQFITVVE